MTTTELPPLAPPIMLASGRLIVHVSYTPEGAQRATPLSGPPEMSEAEWADYCQKLVQRQRRNGAAPFVRAR